MERLSMVVSSCHVRNLVSGIRVGLCELLV
jgi:hypothetical protein